MPRLTTLLLTVLAAGPAAAQFTPGTLSVLRVNAGSPTATATSASIVEVDKLTGLPTGYTVNLATPTAANTATGITLNWSTSNPTQLRRSTDGTALSFAGYSTLAGTSIGSQRRNFATVTAGGTASYQTGTGFSVPYSNGSPSAFVTTGASHYFGGVASSQGGLRYANNAGNPSVLTVSDVSSGGGINTVVRDVNIFGSGTNQRLFFVDGSSLRVANPSSGLPTGTVIPSGAIAAAGTPGIIGFYLLDRDPTIDYLGSGADTLYILDGAANSVRKYEYSGTGTTWTQRNGFDPPSLGAFAGLAAEIDGTRGVALYATDASTGRLARIDDASAFGANMSATEVWTLDPTPGSGYRGVDFSPTPVPEPTAVLLIGVAALGGRRIRRKVAATREDAEPVVALDRRKAGGK